MPNEDIDVSNLERLEKYRSFDRYRRRAEQEARAPHWWRTYWEHFGEKSGTGRPEQGLWAPASGFGGPRRRPPRAPGEGTCLQPRARCWRFGPLRIFHTFWSPFLEIFVPSLLDFHFRYFYS